MNEQSIVEQLAQSGFEPVARYELPERPARMAAIPDSLAPAVHRHLKESYPGGLYAHQADAIQEGLRGRDIVLATSTASGKSLVFLTIAANLVTQDPSRRVLALYPAKALIQDQLGKWRQMLEPLGLRFTFIDGSVPPADRPDRIQRAQVVLMTPDVAHAWLMSHLNEEAVKVFLRHMSLLILDESHVYEGAFGTNMAYLLRRLAVAAATHQIICSTATLGEPEDFLEQLTGRRPVVFDPQTEGSPQPGKTILLARCARKSFDSTVDLLKRLAESGSGPFLAFGDSRRAVEQFVAATLRGGDEPNPEAADTRVSESIGDRVESEPDDPGVESTSFADRQILPYRAGYETEDRLAIQEALVLGNLAGVVSTSALELGLDIGEIELVVLLDIPPTMKGLWQRIGRAAEGPGGCVSCSIHEAS